MQVQMEVVSSLYKLSQQGGPFPALREASALAGETFAFQVAVRAEKGFCGCALSADGIECGVRFRREIFVDANATGGTYEYDDYYLPEDRLPDILYPVGREGLSAFPGRNLLVWAEFTGLPAGRFRPHIVLRDASGETVAERVFSLTVRAGAPEKSDLFVTHWFHFDCLADVCGEDPFTEKYYRALSPWVENYVLHGNNVILTPLFTPCLDTEVGAKRRAVQLIEVSRRGGEYNFGFKKLDTFIDFMLARGIEYFEMSHLFTQWGALYCPNIIVCEDGAAKEEFGWAVSSQDASYRAFLAKFLPQLTAFLEKKGVARRCLFHISDEPNESTAETYRAHKTFLGRYLKNYTVIDALSSFKFADIVDTPVVAVNHVKPFLEAGRKVWVYYCCSQTSSYVTNALIAMPSLRTRMLGIQLFLNGAAGFLQWGYNFYNTSLSKNKVNPYVDQTGGGAFPSGDPFIVYPGAEGPVDSLRGELFLQAIQDYRLCLTAARRCGAERVRELIRSCGWEGYEVYPHSEERFEELRAQILEMAAE